MNLIMGFIVALLITSLALPLLIRFAPALGLVDEPGERKVHSHSMPRSGGLAIALGFFGSAWFFLPLSGQLWSLYTAGLVIVFFALIDDRGGLSYKQKFVGQIVAVVVLMQGGIVIDNLPFTAMHTSSPIISYALTFFFLIGAINAVNLSDGLDGLAAGITLLSLSLIVLLAYQSGQSLVAFLAMAMIGGLLGLLRYNTYPAQVFLGDTGSQFIGMMLASLAIMVSQSNQSAFSPVLPLLLLGLPILDTLSVMAIRLYQGSSPFKADSNHLHHRLMSLGLYHYQVVASLYLLQIVMVTGAYTLRFSPDRLLVLFYLGVVTVLMLSIVGARAYSSKLTAGKDYAEERRNTLLRRFGWVYQYSTPIMQGVLALFFLQACVYIDGLDADKSQLALWLGLGLLALCVVLRKHPRFAASLCTYLASISIAYFMAVANGEAYSRWIVDGYLIVAVGMLVVAIRMTRKTDFRLDTRDLLILFLVLMASQWPAVDISASVMGRFALRLAILLYISEYLLNKKDCNYWLLSGSAIAGVLLIAWFA